MEYGLIALWLNTLESCFVLYVYFSGHRRLRMRIKTRLRQARGTCCITGGELGVDSSLLGQLNPVNVKCGEQVSQMGLGYANKCRFFPDFLHFVFESGMDARKEDDGLWHSLLPLFYIHRWFNENFSHIFASCNIFSNIGQWRIQELWKGRHWKGVWGTEVDQWGLGWGPGTGSGALGTKFPPQLNHIAHFEYIFKPNWIKHYKCMTTF